MTIHMQELLKAVSAMVGSPIWQVGEDNDGQIIIYTGLTYADRKESLLKPMDSEGGD